MTEKSIHTMPKESTFIHDHELIALQHYNFIKLEIAISISMKAIKWQLKACIPGHHDNVFEMNRELTYCLGNSANLIAQHGHF